MKGQDEKENAMRCSTPDCEDPVTHSVQDLGQPVSKRIYLCERHYIEVAGSFWDEDEDGCTDLSKLVNRAMRAEERLNRIAELILEHGPFDGEYHTGVLDQVLRLALGDEGYERAIKEWEETEGSYWNPGNPE